MSSTCPMSSSISCVLVPSGDQTAGRPADVSSATARVFLYSCWRSEGCGKVRLIHCVSLGEPTKGQMAGIVDLCSLWYAMLQSPKGRRSKGDCMRLPDAYYYRNSSPKETSSPACRLKGATRGTTSNRGAENRKQRLWKNTKQRPVEERRNQEGAFELRSHQCATT
jgi:hypothetical protein